MEPQIVPYLILRHDIDYCPPLSLKIAQIEKSLCIKSTYFVLISTDFYNIQEEKNIRSIEEISSLGHEIGLHYCPSQYRQSERRLNKTLNREIQLLEDLLGKKVYSIARHGFWDRDPFATSKKYINANHPFMRRDLFVHDSYRAWTPVEGLFKLLTDPPKRVQLLTHPDTWQEDKINREQFLERFFQYPRKKEVIELKERTKKRWLSDPTVIEHDRLIESKDFAQNSEKNTLCHKLVRNLDYYLSGSKWYLINTSLGWSFHNQLEKIRNALKS